VALVVSGRGIEDDDASVLVAVGDKELVGGRGPFFFATSASTTATASPPRGPNSRSVPRWWSPECYPRGGPPPPPPASPPTAPGDSPAVETVGPWSPAIPAKVGPTETGGDKDNPIPSSSARMPRRGIMESFTSVCRPRRRALRSHRTGRGRSRTAIHRTRSARGLCPDRDQLAQATKDCRHVHARKGPG